MCSPPKVKSPSIPIYLTSLTLFYLPPAPSPLVTTILLSVSMSSCLPCLFICCTQFYIPHTCETIWFLTFSIWLTLLSMTFSRSIHVVANDSILPFLVTVVVHNIYVYMYICVCACTPHLYPVIYWRDLQLFHVLATVNSAAMNIGIHIFLQINVFKILG